MYKVDDKTRKELLRSIINIVSETNGIGLKDSLDLLLSSDLEVREPVIHSLFKEFRELLGSYQHNQVSIQQLLNHPVSDALFEFFRNFPLKYKEEHIHLTGSLTADFIFSRLQSLLQGPHKEIYERKITEVYGPKALPIESAEDVDNLIRLKEGEGFDQYLKILYLPKLILTSREAHEEAAYHMAEELYYRYNVGRIRLKFMLSRSSSSSDEQVPGLEEVTPEDVVLGLYEGFNRFRKEKANFNFVLSPSFRKERSFFDNERFESRREHFMDQIRSILSLLEKYPFLEPHMCEVDTVGNERDMYRKEHFFELQTGFRKLQYRGFKIRSHHGEVWHTLKKGIQSVDNAMNIWHIDTLEHGLSLGINPNVYFHRLFQLVMEKNKRGVGLKASDPEYPEVMDLEWSGRHSIRDKLIQGEALSDKEITLFIKAKFHTAREVETYQHDVLNRMINMGVSLISLPSSNNKLTGKFEDYKDHPFSWWEKKGVQLGMGTDNYVTLNTNYISEMLILLFTDADNLKITKLLMVCTGETRRPFISHLLWKMRKIDLGDYA